MTIMGRTFLCCQEPYSSLIVTTLIIMTTFPVCHILPTRATTGASEPSLQPICLNTRTDSQFPQMPPYWANLPTVHFTNPHNQQPKLAILPLGSLEQHGPHLPLGTDTYIAEGIIAQAITKNPAFYKDIVILPTNYYGASFEHASFSGTIPISDDIVNGLWEEILKGIIRSTGIKKIVVVNGHGGQNINVEMVVRKIRFEYNDRGSEDEDKVFVVGVNLQNMLNVVYGEITGDYDGTGDNDNDDDDNKKREKREDTEWERKYGIHGGLIETSIMLYLKKELVKIDKVERFQSNVESLKDTLLFPYGDSVFYGWLIQDLNKNGVVGNAKLASVDLGEKLVNKVARKLAQLFDEIMNR